MTFSMRYRQLGYGYPTGIDDWRAVWLDVDSIGTGKLLTVTYDDFSHTYLPFNGTIYRTISMVVLARSLSTTTQE